MALELTWAKQRRIIIVLIVLAFFSLVAGAFYLYFRTAATCSDGRQNGRETGIDCGGGCSRICSMDTKPLVIDWVRLFKIRDGEYSVLARVENPNFDSIAENVPYTFNLKDSSGATVISKSGTAFVPSRKTFVVYQGTIRTDASPVTVDFAFDSLPDWHKSDYVEPDLTIGDKSLTGEENLPHLDATVNNPNIIDVDDVTLTAVIYDDEGNAVQVSQTYLERLKAGTTANLSFTWPLPVPLKSRICEAPVDVSLVIDRSGSMQYLGTNPPQPLADVKAAANSFAEQLTKYDQASVVSFGNEATDPADVPLTADLSSVKQAIEDISIIQPANLQNTNLADGLLKGGEELLSSAGRSGSGKIIVALTDGVATRPLKAGVAKYPETYAIEVAKAMKDKGIRIFTIGLGKDLNQDFLKNVATAPSDFYLAPTASDLEGIYHEIGLKMCKRRPTALEIFVSIPPKK